MQKKHQQQQTVVLTAANTTPQEELISVGSVFDSTYSTAPEFSRHQKNAYAETLKAYGGGHDILKAYVMPNSSSFNSMAYPTGHVIMHKYGARVSPVSISPHMYKVLVLCPVIPDTKQVLKDAFFEGKLAQLESCVRQYATEMPLNAGTRDTDNNDYEHWVEELGENGSVGVVKRKESARHHRYFVAACVGAPVLGADIIQELRDPECDLTWKDVVKADYDRHVKRQPYMYWREAARRNACRVAFRAAEALGVVIPTIDEDGEVKDPGSDASKRATADPQYTQYVSDTGVSKADGVLTCGAMYSHCAPLTEINKTYHLISVSPAAGLVGIKLQPGFSRALNAHSSVLPTTTGRRTAVASIDTSTIPEEERDDISSAFTWEGKEDEFNDRLHPDAYRAFDDEFIDAALASQGWDKGAGYDKFETVIMKIPSRKPRPDVGV